MSNYTDFFPIPSGGGGGGDLVPTNQIILSASGDNVGASALTVPDDIVTGITDNGSYRVRSILVGGGYSNSPGAVVNRVHDLTVLDYDPITLIQTADANTAATTMAVEALPTGGVVGGLFEHDGEVYTITVGAAGATQITFEPQLGSTRSASNPILNVHIDSDSPTISYRIAPANSSLSNTITAHTVLAAGTSTSVTTGYAVRDGDCGNGFPNYSTYTFNVASDAFVNAEGYPLISTISWQPASGTTYRPSGGSITAAPGYDSNPAQYFQNTSNSVYPLNIQSPPAGQTAAFSSGTTNFPPTISGTQRINTRSGLFPWDGITFISHGTSVPVPDAGPTYAVAVVAAIGGTPQIIIRRSVGRSNFFDGTSFQFSNVRLANYTYLASDLTWRTYTANSTAAAYADNSVSSDGSTSFTSWSPSSGYAGYNNITTANAVANQVGSTSQQQSTTEFLERFPAGKAISDWGQRGEIALYY